jgi:Tfp pilus assembly protein PilV
MKPTVTSRQQQTGAYLLEALIGILIFALGVLGIVGLQAASLRTTADSGLRAEAVFAANQLLGEMWTDDEANLIPNYDSTLNGQPYQDFVARLTAAQGGAWACNPTVNFDNFVAKPSKTSHSVTIQIFWQSDTGEALAGCANGAVKVHSYTTSGVVGQNVI